MWMLPLYLHVNQKSDYDDDMKCLSTNWRENIPFGIGNGALFQPYLEKIRKQKHEMIILHHYPVCVCVGGWGGGVGGGAYNSKFDEICPSQQPQARFPQYQCTYQIW